MKRIFYVAPLGDGQTGHYIYDAFKKLGYGIAHYDARETIKKLGSKMLIKHMKANIDALVPKPDMMFVLKGLTVPDVVIDYAKSKGIHTACWIFDATLQGVPIPECKFYIEKTNHYDVFYNYCNNIDDLKDAGAKNPKLLPEGYSEKFSKPEVLNKYISRKFGADIVFIGTIDNIHPEREDYIERIIDEGFDIKIFGELKKDTSPKLIEKHQKMIIINEFHSYACQSSKICIGGLDSDYMVDQSQSARVYRTLACGGFYLCRHTNGIEKAFTPGVHLATFKDKDDMVKKIIYYLNHPEEREKIAKAGMEKVKEYTFIKRLEKEFGRGDK